MSQVGKGIDKVAALPVGVQQTPDSVRATAHVLQWCLAWLYDILRGLLEYFFYHLSICMHALD